MTEADEIEEAAGRVIDKLETEIDQLRARVAELEEMHAVGWNRLEELDDEMLEQDRQLETKTEQCEAWKEATEVPFRHTFSCINGNDADRCSCDSLRFVAIKKARALEAKSETEGGKS